MMSATLILETLGWVPVVGLVVAHLLVDRGRLPRDGTALRIAGCAAAAVVVAAAVVANLWPVAALGLLWLRTEVFANRHPIHDFQVHREQARLARAGQAPAQPAKAQPEKDLAGVPGGRDGDPNPDAGTEPADQPDQSEPAGRSEAIAPELAHASLAQLELGDPVQPSTPARPAPLRPRQISQGHANPGQSDRHPRTPSTLPRPRASYGASRPSHTQPSRTAGTHKSLGPRIVDAIFRIEVIIVAIAALVLFGSWAQHQNVSFTHNANSSLCRLMGGC